MKNAEESATDAVLSAEPPAENELPDNAEEIKLGDESEEVLSDGEDMDAENEEDKAPRNKRDKKSKRRRRMESIKKAEAEAAANLPFPSSDDEMQDEKDGLKALMEKYLDGDEVDWEGKAAATKNPALKAAYQLRARKQKVEARLISYGPPYEDEYGGDIFEEINKMKPSVIEIHQLLQSQCNPNQHNQKDAENTPMHYCCRYVHFRLGKMLRRAGAQIDKVNEFGITPLQTLCMFRQPEEKQRKQLAFAAYLISHGADVNHVDKGGRTALEYASNTGLLNLCTLLLSFGAHVRRTTEHLSLEAPNAVDVAGSVDVRAILESKLRAENAIVSERKAGLARIAYQAELRQVIKQRRAQAQEKRRLAKIEAARLRALRLGRQVQDIEHLKEMQRKLEAEERAKKLREVDDSTGVWQREGKMIWHFKRGFRKEDAYARTVLHEAEELMHEIEERSRSKKLQLRWRELTGNDFLQPMDPLLSDWEREEEAAMKDESTASSKRRDSFAQLEALHI